MYKITNPMTYGQVVDLLNACDEQDYPIYITLNGNNIPVDNFTLFRELANKDTNGIYPHTFTDEGDKFILS